MPRTTSNDQLGLDEKVIEDPELEDALNVRDDRKAAARDARKAYKEADEAASALIAGQELPEGMTIRVGRFRIERRFYEGREVAFSTDGKSRVRISTVDE